MWLRVARAVCCVAVEQASTWEDPREIAKPIKLAIDSAWAALYRERQGRHDGGERDPANRTSRIRSILRSMLSILRAKVPEVARAVGPLVAVVCVLQFMFVGASAVLFVQFLAGSLLAAVGMVLLFVGIDLGVLPMGRFIGAALPKSGSLWLVVGVAFALGFATTLAEPDVLVLAGQVNAASEGAIGRQTLMYVIATGVGLFAAVALFRVVRGFSMAALLAVIYVSMILLSLAAPADLVPLAYDAGSVTTGVLTAPVVLALALGLSSVLAGRSAIEDGFGLLGLASAGPIVAVLLLGLLTS